MVCQKDCFNCGNTENVTYSDSRKEFYCEECKE